MLTYGVSLDEETKGLLLHIDKVRKGDKCNCICPECDQPLRAKNGSKGGPRSRAHHFAHRPPSKKCEYWKMTELHRLAQQLLQRDGKVMLPSYKKKFVSHAACLKEFSHVELEKVYKDSTSTRRPDCVCSNNGTDSLWVEINCRHKVDPAREDDIIRHGVYCIEIDFTDLLETEYTEETVIARLVHDTDSKHRRWISCPKWDEEERLAEEAAEAQEKTETKTTIPVVNPQSSFDIEAARRVLNAPVSIETLPTQELYSYVHTWKSNERDPVLKDIIGEIDRAPRYERESYQDPSKFKAYVKTLSKKTILTQGEVYKLYKYTMLTTIRLLENAERNDLIELLLNNQGLRDQYLVYMSFVVRHPLLYNIFRIDELRAYYPLIARACDLCYNRSLMQIDDDLKAIITTTNLDIC